MSKVYSNHVPQGVVKFKIYGPGSGKYRGQKCLRLPVFSRKNVERMSHMVILYEVPIVKVDTDYMGQEYRF